jgi:hypothetical protein
MNRSTKDGLSYECKPCCAVRKKKYYSENAEKIRERARDRYHKNIYEMREKNRAYAKENAEAAIVRAKHWYQHNKKRKQEYDKEYSKDNRDKKRAASKRFRENHPNRKRADTALRRAARINATPRWVDRRELYKIYENCPDGCHVDHIVPLRGDGVCGLHVPWNLQYLDATENLKKSNHYSWGEGD